MSLIWLVILPVILAIVIWLIFYPGIWNVDSLSQYRQALNGEFNNWHPPLMAIVLFIVMKSGANIATLMLFQCIAGLLGLMALSYQLLVYLLPESKIKSFIAFLILLLFISPISPFMFHIITFGKDSWLIIFFLWSIAYLLWLNKSVRTNFLAFALHIFSIAVLTAFFPLIRHNAILVLPIIGISLFIIIKKFYWNRLKAIKFGRTFASLAIFLPLAVSLMISSVINSIFDVKNLYVVDYVKAVELSKFIKKNSQLKDDYPLAFSHQNSPVMVMGKSYFDEFDNSKIYFWNNSPTNEVCLQSNYCKNPIGSCESIIDESKDISLSCYRLSSEKSDALDAEYFRALTNYPFSMIVIKLEQFWYMLYFQGPVTFYSTTTPNLFGIVLNEQVSELRNFLSLLYDEVNKSIYWLACHLLWLIIGFSVFIAFLVKAIKNKASDDFFYLSILLIPLSYYLTFALAATNQEYRFMYPSTFLFQVFVTAFIILIRLRLNNKAGVV